MIIRPAREGELSAVMGVLDAGLLSISADTVEAAIGEGRVLVAATDDRVLGALVVASDGPPSGAQVEAVAVRRGRRGQGIGGWLVRAAAARHGPLVAEFDGRVRPFWSSLGFEIEPAAGDDRYLGRGSGGSGTL